MRGHDAVDPVGVHAHNNLSMAVANSIAAYEEGARNLDGTSAGLGAGAGRFISFLVDYIFPYGLSCKFNKYDFIIELDTSNIYLVLFFNKNWTWIISFDTAVLYEQLD